MEISQLYKTRDGKTFDNKIEAEGHERGLDMAVSIGTYLEAIGANPKKALAGTLRKHLAGYAAFIDGLMPKPEVEQEDGAEVVA